MLFYDKKTKNEISNNLNYMIKYFMKNMKSVKKLSRSCKDLNLSI